MSIFVDDKTRLLVQGITGREGEFHTRQMVEYGTRVVAGVTPGNDAAHSEIPGMASSSSGPAITPSPLQPISNRGESNRWIVEANRAARRT